MPHGEPHIEEPQVVDYSKVFNTYYSDGLDMKTARRMLRAEYGKDGRTQFEALSEFYKKKSQENQLGSGSSAETVSTVSTSVSDQEAQIENGGSDSTAVDTLDYLPPVQVGEAPLPRDHYSLGAAQVVTRRRPDAAYWEEDYMKKFGVNQVYKLPTDKILNQQADRGLMAAVNVLERAGFDGWYNKYVSENKQYVNDYLSLSLGKDLSLILGDPNLSKFEYRDYIFNMMGDIDGLKSRGQLSFPGIVREYMKDPLDSKKFVQKAEGNWSDFYRDMVKESLPYSVQKNEDDLKAMEYYFKMGNDDMFDFTGDGEIGWQNWLGQTVLSAEAGGMGFTNKLAWIGSRIGGWMGDFTELIGITPEGTGDLMRDAIEPGLRKREKELEEIRKEMNQYELSISQATSKWIKSRFTDTQAFGNMFEQSFNMTVEAAPTLGLAVATGVMTKSPTAVAALMTADGTAQRSMNIRNDITFDQFIPKEEFEKLKNLEEKRSLLESKRDDLDVEFDQDEMETLNNQIRNINGEIRELREERYDYYSATSTLSLNPDDTMEDIQALLEDKFVMERDDSSRGQYLAWTAGIDFLSDVAIFKTFSKALIGANFDPLNVTVKDAIKEMAKGSGYALANGSIPMFASAYNDEYQRAVATDAEFDPKQAFENAMDVTIGFMGVGPTLHTGGTSLAYSRAISMRTAGIDGINALQRKAINEMWDRSKDPELSGTERAEALKMWHQFRTDQLQTQEKNTAFFEYIGRQDKSAHDDIANLDNKMIRLMKTFENIEDVHLKMMVRQELSKLYSDQQTLMKQFEEGFEAVYPHSTLRPKPQEAPKAKGVAKDTPKTDEAEEVSSADGDALKKPDDSDAPLVKAVDEEGIKGEDKEMAPVGEGLLGWRFFRNTFRSDSGIGGQRGWNPFKSRSGKREQLSENIRAQQREGTLIQNQLTLDLNTIDGVRSSVQFTEGGKKIPKGEFTRRQAEIDKYLSGEEARIAFLNKDQKAALDFLRNRVDVQTGKLIHLLKKNPTERNRKLIETLEANKGQYLRRSYEAFSDDGSWIKKLADPKRKGKFKDLYENAVEYVMTAGTKKQIGVSGKETDASGKVIKKGEPVYSTEPISRKTAEEIVSDYIRELNDRMFGNSPNIQTGGGILGALDSKMLKGRKNIPEPFRKLLGEIDDVSYNYTNTMFRLSNYVSDLTFHNIVREQLLDLNLATEKTTPQQTNFVSLDAGKAYSGLDGLFVDPIFKDMFDSMKPLGVPQGPFSFKDGFSVGGLQRQILRFQANVKIGKTVLSPITTVRNFLSGVMLSLNAGKFSFTNPKNWSNASTLAWGTDAPSKTALGKQRNMLIKQGVIQDGARGGEILNLLRDFDTNNQAQKIAKNQRQKNRLDKKAGDLTQKAYAFGDDFYKVLHFYDEYNGLIKSGMDEAQARDMAGVRTRGSMPTYSYVPRNVKMMRGFPLTGTFVSFPYEVYRTTGNNYRYMMQDFAQGRTEMGMKRAVGMVIAMGGVYALSKESMDMFGFTEEHVETLRETGPDYQENILPIYMGDEDGIARFFDASSVFPSEELMKPLRIIAGEGDPRDTTYTQRGISAISEMLDPFLGTDITVNWAQQIFNNKKENSGQPIYYEDKDKSFVENIRDNAPKIAKWSMETIGPGGYQVFREWARAMNIAPEWFGEHKTMSKEMNLSDLMLSMLGARPQMIEPTMAVMGNVYEELSDLNEYSGFEFTSKNLRLWEDKDMDFIQQQAHDYVDKQMKVNGRINHYAELSKILGASDKQIIESLTRSKVSEKNAAILLANALEGANNPLNVISLSKSKMDYIMQGIENTKGQNSVEKARRKANVIEAMDLFNRFVDERWVILNQGNDE